MPVRAGQILRVRPIWIAPLVLGSVVLAVMTALYIGAVVDPLAHLHGLPVAVVNQDRGATVGTQHLDAGQQIEAGLLASPAVSDRLHLEVLTLPQAEQAMGRDALYATLVIPQNFTSSLLYVAGLGRPSASAGPAAAAPRVEILINERAGTVGTNLATEILQPALAVASHRIGGHLAALVPPSSLTGASRVLLADPITVVITQFRPLPANSALGLSAFYVALLTLMCGFFGAVIVNSVVDSALGYATNEVGPRWRQRQPVPINRWQTLQVKWAIIVVLTAVLTAVMIAIAAGGLGMDAPYPALLWLYTWLCAASVGIGTIALFAVAGTYGQLIGLLLFVYAGLASAGGTVPVEALPSVLRLLSYVEPLRQVLAGTRSILYFGAKGDAGLARGTLEAALGLLFWLLLGSVVVMWYDRKGLYRLQPDLLAYVNKSVEGYRAGQAGAAPAPSDAGQPPPDDASSGPPRHQGESPPTDRDPGHPDGGAADGPPGTDGPEQTPPEA
jgi:YhgE/Pip-like protein